MASDLSPAAEALLVDLRADFGEHLFFTDKARALLAAYTAKVREERDREWNDACLQATAGLKSVGVPCSPTPFEIRRMTSCVRVAALEEAESLLRACGASDVSCPSREEKATVLAIAEEVHSWIDAAIRARGGEETRP